MEQPGPQRVQIFRETRLSDGYRIFKTLENDASEMDILLTDYTGRTLPTKVPTSTVLVMVPTGQIGACVFEQAVQFDGQQVHRIRDAKTGFLLFAQRNVLGEGEVHDLFEMFYAQKQPASRLASGGEIRRFLSKVQK